MTKHSDPHQSVVAVAFQEATPNALRIVTSVLRLGKLALPVVDDEAVPKWTEMATDIDALAPVVVRRLRDPSTAVSEILRQLRERRLGLENWVNLVDALSETMFLTLRSCDIESANLHCYMSCRLKPLMREAMSTAGLSKVRARLAEVSDALANIEYPVVVKPLCGYGSMGVRLLRSKAEWDRYRSSPALMAQDTPAVFGLRTREQVLVEPYFAGLECRADGFVHGGVVHICMLSMRVTEENQGHFREAGGIAFHPEHYPFRSTEFCAWVSDVLRAVRFESGVFHLEAVELCRGSFELIELNPRPGGGGVSELVHRLSGVRLVEEFVRLWLGFAPSALPIPRTSAGIVYGVLYGDVDGEVAKVTARTDVAVNLGWEGPLPGTWMPFVEVGERLNPSEAEHYLGEVHVEADKKLWSSQDAGVCNVKRIVRWLRHQGFVNMRALPSTT